MDHKQQSFTKMYNIILWCALNSSRKEKRMSENKLIQLYK